eukprot:389702_1
MDEDIWGTNDDKNTNNNIVDDMKAHSLKTRETKEDDLFENIGDINNKPSTYAQPHKHQQQFQQTNPFSPYHAHKQNGNKETENAVRIINTEERKGKLTKFTAYVIESTVFSTQNTRVGRRFNDFKWLHNSLGMEYLGVFIPPLPPDNTFDRFKDDVVSQRRYDLERCLNRLAHDPILCKSACFELFLCEQNDVLFEEQKKAYKKTLYERTEYDIHSLLTRSFEDSDEADVADFLTMKPGSKHGQQSNENTYQLDIPRVREFFMRCDERLSVLNKICLNLFGMFVQIKEELNVFGTTLNGLYDAEYNDRPVVMMDECLERHNIRGFINKWAEIEEAQTCAFYQSFLLNLRYEHEDVKAILDQFTRYDAVYNKYKKQKASLNKLNDKYPDKNHTECEDKLNQIKTLLDKICCIILINQTPALWSKKIKSYNKAVQQYIKA